ncbi:hypothetical protein DFH29DRAFT_882603 [Suillus ampliporus]|nr:hypothetical protein DFH29DRAFT_882603 [Suillus ampliporus]
MIPIYLKKDFESLVPRYSGVETIMKTNHLEVDSKGWFKIYVEAVLEVKDGNYDSVSLEKKREVPGELFSLNSEDTKYLLVVKASQLQAKDLSLTPGNLLPAVVMHESFNCHYNHPTGDEYVRGDIQHYWVTCLWGIEHHRTFTKKHNMIFSNTEHYITLYQNAQQNRERCSNPQVWEKFYHHQELSGQQAIGKRATSTTSMTIEENIKPFFSLDGTWQIADLWKNSAKRINPTHQILSPQVVGNWLPKFLWVIEGKID